MKKLIIFDLDGTVLNTIGGIGSACNEMLAYYDLPTWKLTDYERFVGDGSRMLIKRALPAEKAADESFVDEARDVYLKYYRANLARETHPYEGMPELLEELQEKGFTLAVASNKFDDGAKFLIPHFYPQIKWAAVEGQKPGGPLKPAPGIIDDAIAHSILTANRLPVEPAMTNKFGRGETQGIPKSEILYIGDCEVDIQSAERAGLDYVLCTWGFRRRAALEAAGAKALIDTPSELLRHLG
ncbi:MAG: HAD hydrolase-like protein [Bacteroidales bacterium]|nr:HAD hydrolase-like protein [Bacteroidales bacterium]